LKLWWDLQDDTTKNITRNLVKNGQLEFVNGGWAAHDEACNTYQDMIANMMIGHNFILNEFGESAIPKIGWSLDSFGHSLTNAKILSQLGYDALIFARLDDDERNWRKENKQLEFIWKLSENTEIFTHVLNKHYTGPDILIDSILPDDKILIFK
jgi:hypothetical protein